ncbi:single-stranded-DNA-specific exonuclease RecJ [Butyrivibrio sp. WCD3002]|uniref:single-stranded-DNA-specific exonuclease RecJ n=1 Tax=Butyrivibrio sp. WCD3002 TaxID=1280676 RepID=UPI000416A915|nr:single-stranded-DNA-specific exonuclease RecJ [Butyrivibrio sp. WCD3002]
MAKWFVTRKGADFNKIGQEHGISPITARLLRNRDVYEFEDVEAFLHSDIRSLHNPHDLFDIDKAAAIMKECIERGDNIRIIGDYDVDGICSSYILYEGIKKCEGHVDVRLPHRVEDGYGLSDSLIDKAHEEGIATIITCDNGIAAIAQVAHAKELGMTVIVTDHHEVLCDSEDKDRMLLPDADAVVDPKRKDDDSHFREICGAMVAYKFVCVLTELMGIPAEQNDEFFRDLRIFAGWATVCDVMPLKDENRIIVKDSFKNIPLSHNVGLNALIRECGIEADSVNCYIYGFVLGPCLNATGRLDTAMRGLELLLEQNPDAAAGIARELKELNDSRKDMTKEGQDAAMVKLEEYNGQLPKVLVIYLPELHESLAGIIAGRVREATHRPTYILTDTRDGMLKGSGRSIEAYHMHDALSECRELLLKFGGHKMAAGFSLEKENLEAFNKALNDNCNLAEDDFQEVLHIDMELPPEYLNIPLLREFEEIGPYGTGNEEPLFAARNIELLRGRVIGKNANVGKFQIMDTTGRCYDMMVFNGLDKWDEFLNETFGEENVKKLYNGSLNDKMYINMAYKPQINDYRGVESLQIILKDYMKCTEKKSS